MNRQIIRINESQLRQIVTESINRVLDEISASTVNNYMQGRAEQSRGERPISNAIWHKYAKEYRRRVEQGELDGISMKQYIRWCLGKDAERTNDRESFNYAQAAMRGANGGDATYRDKQAKLFGQWNDPEN